MFGKLFWGFLIVIAVLGVIGFLQMKRQQARTGKKDENQLSDKTWDNVVDLRDRFNRAREMDQDKG